MKRITADPKCPSQGILSSSVVEKSVIRGRIGTKNEIYIALKIIVFVVTRRHFVSLGAILISQLITLQ